MILKNVALNKERAMSKTNLSAKEIVAKIATHIAEKNPATRPHFQPYIKLPGIGFSAPQSFIHIDLTKLYPEAKPGNTVFVACKIHVPEDSEISVLINGDVKLWYHEKCVFTSKGESAEAENGYSVKRIDAVKLVTGVDEAWCSNIKAKEGNDNDLIIEVVCGENDFAFDFNLSHPNNLTVWATDYLIWVREESPIPALAGEEGMAVSPLYQSEEEGEKSFFSHREYAFPKVEEEGSDFDLNRLYQYGKTAYAYTQIVSDGEIVIHAKGSAQILKNGCVEAEIIDESYRLRCRKGDEVMIKCLESDGKWGFSIDGKENTGLPFVQKSPERDLHFLFCGPFDKASLHIKLAPEYQKNFSTPFKNEKGEWVYWRFFTEETYLRAYLNSSFYGQWYYPPMLSLLGMYQVGDILDNAEFDRFFYEGAQQMAEFADYICMDAKKYVSAAFMPHSTRLYYLDHIGTMGVNFAEAYKKSRDPLFIPLLERLRGGIDHVVPRFPDGTFCRMEANTMWADDVYMGCPFVVRLADYTGNSFYYDEAIRQLMGSAERLYMEDQKIFSHIYFIKEATANRIPWGRGNGWIAVAMTEILMHLPEDYPGREKVLTLYQEFMQGICDIQHESGMWHQILNRPDTYLETSCTAMFMLSLLRGVRYGWLEKKYEEVALKAWNSLKENSLDIDGTVYGVCMGSSCSMEAKYYENIPTIADDDHGTSVVLMAIVELVLWEKWKEEKK